MPFLLYLQYYKKVCTDSDLHRVKAYGWTGSTVIFVKTNSVR